MPQPPSACIEEFGERDRSLMTASHIYHPMDVPGCLRPFVRRVLATDTKGAADITIDVRGSGYHYLGFVWRGRWQGQVDGLICFDSDIDGRIHLSGQVSTADVFAKMSGNFGHIVLEFTALGHFQLLGIDGQSLINDAKAPQLLNVHLGTYLEKIEAPKYDTNVANLDLIAEVLSQIPKHSVADDILQALNHIEAADGNVRMSALLAQLGLPERKFRDDFKRLIGLTPKAFCKTLQVNKALNQLIVNNGGDLAGISTDAGFSDQAHFTRAFSEFLGDSPARYLKNIEATLARFLGQSRQ